MRKVLFYVLFALLTYSGIVLTVANDYADKSIDAKWDAVGFLLAEQDAVIHNDCIQQKINREKADSCLYIGNYFWEKRENTAKFLPVLKYIKAARCSK